LRTIDRPEPLTPTLSHKGRGSSPPLLREERFIRKFERRKLLSDAVPMLAASLLRHPPPPTSRASFARLGPHHSLRSREEGAQRRWSQLPPSQGNLAKQIRTWPTGNCFGSPPPRAAVGRGRGWGVSPRAMRAMGLPRRLQRRQRVCLDTACNVGSESAEAPPTPNPSPPLASLAGGGGAPPSLREERFT
jgi:hypothetical protein